MKNASDFRRLAAAVVLATATAPIWSATTSTTFTVSSTVVATCNVSAGALNFGSMLPTPIQSNVDATSSISATCSNSVPYSIALNAGTGTGATVALRKMSSGADTLNYQLYTDSQRTAIWGDGTAGTTVSNQTGSGSAQTITVYGRIPTGQTPPVGSYTDTITVTVTF